MSSKNIPKNLSNNNVEVFFIYRASFCEGECQMIVINLKK